MGGPMRGDDQLARQGDFLPRMHADQLAGAPSAVEAAPLAVLFAFFALPFACLPTLSAFFAIFTGLGPPTAGEMIEKTTINERPAIVYLTPRECPIAAIADSLLLTRTDGLPDGTHPIGVDRAQLPRATAGALPGTRAGRALPLQPHPTAR